MQHAAKAAVNAAAIEAIRVRKEPGPWTGAKGTRVATAAFGAATAGRVAGAVKDEDEKHGTRHLMQSVVGGLITSRIVNGSKDDMKRDRRR